MNCLFISTTPGRIRCTRCNREMPLVGESAMMIFRRCEAAPNDDAALLIGPGTELTGLLHQLGMRDESQCQCQTRANQMNAWGIAGCREHFDEIVAWLRESYDRVGWADKLKAAASAISAGLTLQIDPRDPPRSLAELAIQRAEEKANRP